MKWHDNLIKCMVKHRPLMYNRNVKKTFEILRSEITFVMDLYTVHNKFSNFLCFASFLCSSLCSANYFQLQ